MKKLLTVVVILLVVVAGVVLGVMQPWKKDGDSQKSEGKSTPQESASAKGTNGNGDSKGTKAPKNPPATTNDEMRTIPTRRVPTRSVPAKKTEKHADENSTEPAHTNPKPNVLVGEKNPPSDPGKSLIGSWEYAQDRGEDGIVNFTIILEKDGKGKVRLAQGEQKADFPVLWKADGRKLTLTGNDPKTQEEDVDEGTYKLDGGFLEYELEGEKFTLIRVKD